jgi:hypothetical protein
MNPHGREADSEGQAKGTFDYLSWPRRRAVARLARRIREDSIWIRRACLTQPDVQQATALRVAARSRRDFVARLAKDWPLPSARASSRHRSGLQRGSREVVKGAHRHDCRRGFSPEPVVKPFAAKAAPTRPQHARRVATPLKKSDVRIRFAVPAFGWGFRAQARTTLLRSLQMTTGIGRGSRLVSGRVRQKRGS